MSKLITYHFDIMSFIRMFVFRYIACEYFAYSIICPLVLRTSNIFRFNYFCWWQFRCLPCRNFLLRCFVASSFCLSCRPIFYVRFCNSIFFHGSFQLSPSPPRCHRELSHSLVSRWDNHTCYREMVWQITGAAPLTAADRDLRQTSPDNRGRGLPVQARCAPGLQVAALAKWGIWGTAALWRAGPIRPPRGVSYRCWP